MNGETGVMKRILLDLAGRVTLFRNNVGAAKTTQGTFVRYGVGGPGGADLIGFKSFLVEPHHLGQRVAQFLAIEVKTPDGSATPEQLRFIKFILESGGLAGIARSSEDAQDIIA